MLAQRARDRANARSSVRFQLASQTDQNAAETNISAISG